MFAYYSESRDEHPAPEAGVFSMGVPLVRREQSFRPFTYMLWSSKLISARTCARAAAT